MKQRKLEALSALIKYKNNTKTYMKISTLESIAILAITILSVSLGLGIGNLITRTQMQKEAISLNFAQYNPTNGLFEWKVSREISN